jgi:putative heme-binding domain-containing protein
MSFDDYGRKFACSNSDHLQYFVYDDRYAARNPFFSMPPPRQSIAADGGAAEVFRISPDEPWRIVRTRWRVAGVVRGVVEGGGRVSGYFTGATGTTVYRGDAYGDDFKNNTFTGDAGGQLVHRKKIHADGVSLIGRRPDDEQNSEFAASRDTWVRVVNFANAPDGCLHVIDMYREVIEHPWSIPDEIKKHLDLNSGNDRGRIYRIEPKRADWQRRASVDLSKASIAELVKTLEHPNGWQRDTAARLLYEKQDKSAIPLLKNLLSESSNPLAKIHALGALDGFKAVTEAEVIKLLADKDEHVSERGILAAQKLDQNGFVTADIQIEMNRLANDPSPRLRFVASLVEVGWREKMMARYARAISTEKPTKEDFREAHHAYQHLDIMGESLASVLNQHPDDKWLLAAVLSNPPDVIWAMFSKMQADGEAAKNASVQAAILSALGGSASEADITNTRGNALEFLSENPRPELVSAFAQGLKRSGTTIAKVDADHKLASVFANAAAIVRDTKAADAERTEGIKLVSLDTPKEAGPALLSCLAKSQPEAVQSAGVAALGQFGGSEVTDALIAHWPDFSRKTRAAAFAVLLGRPERATALLHAIEAKKIAASELAASDVQALFKHKDSSVATLADNVLAELKPPSRASVIAKFAPALAAKGDASRGQQIYAERCMSCHRAGGQGIQLGPDLITVKAKGRDGILTAILDPNKEVAPQFIAYTVETKDGQSLTGFIAKDDASGLTLKMIGGAEQMIPRARIKGSSSSGLSLMPEGIESGMDVQAMADLLTFIEELK